TDDPPSRDETDEAAVIAIVTIVSHHEIEAARDDDRPERADCRNLRREHHFVRPAGKVLFDEHRVALLAIDAEPDRTPCRGFSIHVKLVVMHVDPVAGNADDARREPRSVDRGKQYADVATMRTAPLDQLDGG